MSLANLLPHPETGASGVSGMRPTESHAAPDPEPASDKHVLIVDDDEVMLALFRRVLLRKGYSVTTATCGEEALKVVDERRPDLLLLDISMPDMSGLELLEALRKHPDLFDVPAIFISALCSEEMISTGVSLGADDYLVKPVQPAELAAKVAMTFRRRQLARLTSAGFAHGALFAGRYEIVGTLGSGGYGTVYLANDRRATADARVALKVFHSDRVRREGFIPRFLREAYAHSRMRHPNIVRLLDFGQQDNTYYMVMEFLDGLNLNEILQNNGPLDRDTAIIIAYEMVLALDYLHHHGAVHRDVKPRNIMVTHDGQTKLLDFGRARHASEDTLSVEENIGGTPHFLSPEYITSSRDLDIRSDIYSLGMTLYHLVSNTSCFPDCTDLELINHHLHTEPVPLGRKMPHPDAPFCELVDAMIRKDREQRPSLAALQERLAAMMA